jgi:hypothetical protein
MPHSIDYEESLSDRNYYSVFRRASSILASSGLLFLLIACDRNPNSAETEGSGPEAQTEAYMSKIELSHVGLSKGENYLGDEVFYVEGTLKNKGDKLVQRIELTFLFKDSLNQVVLREKRRALDYKGNKGLEPQKSTNFQIGFERLPRDWNYGVPEAQVTNVILK